MNPRHLAVVLAAGCLLLAGCGGAKDASAPTSGDGSPSVSPSSTGMAPSMAPSATPSSTAPAGPVIQGQEVTLTAPAGAKVGKGQAPWQKTFHVGPNQGLIVQLNEQDCACDLSDDQAGVDSFAATALKLNTFGLKRQPDATVGGHLFAHLAGKRGGYAHETYGTYDDGLLITIEFIIDPSSVPLAKAEPMISSILASARFKD